MKIKLVALAAGLLILALIVTGRPTLAQDQNQTFLRSVEIITENAYLWLGKSVTIWFEGATTDAFQTQLTVVDPTADRVLTFPNTTGHVTAAEDGVTASGIRAGSTYLDGSNPTSVTTGLSALVACDVNFATATAPGDDPNSFTVDIHTSGTLSIYAWKNTSGTDPTQTASTDATAQIRWWCIGTP